MWGEPDRQLYMLLYCAATLHVCSMPASQTVYLSITHSHFCFLSLALSQQHTLLLSHVPCFVSAHAALALSCALLCLSSLALSCALLCLSSLALSCALLCLSSLALSCALLCLSSLALSCALLCLSSLALSCALLCLSSLALSCACLALSQQSCFSRVPCFVSLHTLLLLSYVLCFVSAVLLSHVPCFVSAVLLSHVPCLVSASRRSCRALPCLSITPLMCLALSQHATRRSSVLCLVQATRSYRSLSSTRT